MDLAFHPAPANNSGIGNSTNGGGAAAEGTPSRYDFEVPDHLTISDMLAIQLAECVRIVHTLSDEANDRRLNDYERMQTIHSLDNVVKSSETLTRTIATLGGNTAWDEAEKTGRKKR